jgi:enoyl-CoA hydratase
VNDGPVNEDRVNDSVLTSVQGGVLVVELNRPEARNAIDGDVAEGLVAAMRRLDDDPELRVGVMAGRGGVFCSGMDLKAFAKTGVPKGLDEFLWDGARKPLLCAIERFALAGGLELALTCDVLVAASDTKFGIPETKVGLFAAGGGLLRLPRRLPYGVAMELALTGDTITAEDAHAHGLVTHLTEPGRALEVAVEIAQRIAANAPLALMATKRLIRETQGRTEAEFIEFQKPLFKEVFRSNDAKEGPRAFAEKRPPIWSGT